MRTREVRCGGGKRALAVDTRLEGEAGAVEQAVEQLGVGEAAAWEIAGSRRRRIPEGWSMPVREREN
jgi:hypothetical protein